jgi:5-oxoprolinase (ATP-hydrolysing) subunit A
VAERIDLNADMGESYGRWTLGDDDALMPFLTSANIACGFHGGDPHVMRRTVALALEHGVGIGAHVGFPDLIGFGRRRMAASPDEIRDYVLYQSGALQAFAEAAGGLLQHVKPHGALYTTIVESPEHADAVAQAVAKLGADVILLMPPEVGPAAARAGVPFVPEGYVDLDYDGEGKLVLERVKQLRDPQRTAERALRLAREGTVETVEGGTLELRIESICVHGDAPNAPAIAQAIRETLEQAGIALAPLAELQASAPAAG